MKAINAQSTRFHENLLSKQNITSRDEEFTRQNQSMRSY